jgi:hypothetical protein
VGPETVPGGCIFLAFNFPQQNATRPVCFMSYHIGGRPALTAPQKNAAADLADVERVLSGVAVAFEGIVRRWQFAAFLPAVAATGWAVGAAVDDFLTDKKQEGKFNKSTFVSFEPCCFPTHFTKNAKWMGHPVSSPRGPAKLGGLEFIAADRTIYGNWHRILPNSPTGFSVYLIGPTHCVVDLSVRPEEFYVFF